MRGFFETPFKAACLALTGAATLMALGGPTPAEAETKLKADLKYGGDELYQQIIPSIIQVTNGGAGSGYMIDKGGYAITNTHVTHPNKVFEVAFYHDFKGGKRYQGQLVAEDAALDFALIKVEAPDDMIVPIKLADTDTLQVGDTVATCGSPGGMAGDTNISDYRDGWLDFFNFNLGTLTEILPMENALLYFSYQARGGVAFAPDYATAVQYLFHVDSAINHGNSGGPAVSARGEAIGTNTWGYGAEVGVTENMGYSVPVNLLARSAREILQYGRVRRPWLGITLHDPNPRKGYERDSAKGLTDMLDTWIDPTPKEMKIYKVDKYAPASKYLKKGDILHSVDGRQYENIFDIYKYILNKQVGDKITLHIERNGIGLPPLTIQLEEKRNRINALRIDSEVNTQFGYGGYGNSPSGAGIMQITY